VHPERRLLDADGFLPLRGVLGPADLAGLLPALEDRIGAGSAGTRAGIAGIPGILEALRSDPVRDAFDRLGFDGAFPTRLILFDKSPKANWGVPWHQDLAIQVRRRVEVAGFTGWSTKQGIPHVLPPVAVLEEMVTLRIALDACGPDDGPLRVLPGTHRCGRLDAATIVRLGRSVEPVDCTARAGDAVLMRPLLLHASSPARVPTRRRVLHVEWALRPLPGGLEWDSFEP
jgi:hypothetical protein